jgi:hypothetical protein
VCEKDYDKRHPQDAVRETGSGCGTGPGGAGLDWNWGGGGYKPDLDPSTFIKEPNDAYFTNPPDGTFDPVTPPTTEEEVLALGPWWWMKAHEHDEDYTDGETLGVVPTLAVVDDFSGNDRHFDVYDNEGGNVVFNKNVTNGYSALTFSPGLAGTANSATLFAGNSPSYSGPPSTEYEDMIVWVFIVVDNIEEFTGVFYEGEIFSTQTSGRYQAIRYYDEGRSGVSGGRVGKKFFIQNNGNTTNLDEQSVTGTWTVGGGPYLLSGRFHQNTRAQTILRFNGRNPEFIADEGNLVANPIPTKLPQNVYSELSVAGTGLGADGHFQCPEAINFRLDMTNDQVKFVEEYLADKYNITGYSYEENIY